MAQERWSGYLAIVPSMVYMLSMTCGPSFVIFFIFSLDVILFSSDNLLEYLRPFAQQGKIVEEADVTRFFEMLKEKRHHVN